LWTFSRVQKLTTISSMPPAWVVPLTKSHHKLNCENIYACTWKSNKIFHRFLCKTILQIHAKFCT
jgi:hypothetical protein